MSASNMRMTYLKSISFYQEAKYIDNPLKLALLFILTPQLTLVLIRDLK